MSPRRRRAAALLVALLLLLLTGAADGWYRRTFGDDRFEAVEARLNEAVSVDGLLTTVDGYDATYLLKDYRETYRAHGIFLVVFLHGANSGPGTPNVGEAWLESGDFRVQADGGQKPAPPPGFTDHGAFFFDVPPDRLAGARVTFARTALITRYSTRMSVDLGIDADRAAQLSAGPRDRLITVDKMERKAIS